MRANLNKFLKYNSIRRWLDGIEYREAEISNNTLTLYLHYLNKYCIFMRMNPDEIIDERMRHLQSSNPQIRSKHDAKVREYAKWLRENDASPNTISVAVAAVKSFYRYNYGNLVVKQPRTEVVNIRYVPKREEIARVVNNSKLRRWVRAWIIAQAQSGLSLKELRTIDPKLLLKYIDEYDAPIIIPMYRGKEHVDFHAVFGHDACAALREYILTKKPKKILFPYSERAIQLAVREQFEHNGKYVVPHCFRKFFSSTLKTVAKIGDIQGLTFQLIEYWMGHKLDRTTKAYFIPPVEGQRRIYHNVEYLLSFFNH